MTISEAPRRYLFGESDLAAQRLLKLAEVFEPASLAFLSASTAPAGVCWAYDLGCGPGFTTELVARVFRAATTVGLDNAQHFIGLARQQAPASVEFHEHDITKVPFPDGPGGIVYARFVLAHLPNVTELVNAWAGQLLPGGRLLLEEVEWIETSVPAFRTYLDTVEAMLAHNGSQLFAGRALERLEPTGTGTLRNQRIEFDVRNRDAAGMFVPNIATWKSEPFIAERQCAAEIEALTRDLLAQLESPTGQSNIRWTMRQVELERV